MVKENWLISEDILEDDLLADGEEEWDDDSSLELEKEEDDKDEDDEDDEDSKDVETDEDSEDSEDW